MIGRTYNIRGVTLYRKFGKRLFDVLFSASLLIVLSPVILIIALIVYVKMGRPILFSQERPGLNEKIFTLYKFRTMTNAYGPDGKLLPDSSRLSRFGKILRSTSLDELPELWNILKGDMSFVGVWALEYMKLTYKHLKSKGSRAKLILGGWGGGHQLPSLLKGLDRALPQDIIFSCLNPDLGKSPQPDFLEEIARNRSVWAVPWLEGDHQLWHFQPRVNMMREQVKLAAEQNLDGVIAIHWRTEEPRFNFRTFARFASDKGADESVDQLYDRYLTEEFGEEAAKEMTPLLARMDREQIQWNVPSPEFYAYTPEWGLLDENNVRIRQELVSSGESLLKKLRGEKRENLKRFIAMFRFELLLGEVDRAMMPAFILKKKEVQGEEINGSQEYMDAYRLLVSAPVKEMFDTYMERVHSRGELGVLSSLNQRVWREYNDLKIYLENKIKEK